MQENIPVYARNVHHDVDHVAAQLVALHVNRRRVGCDVDFGYDVEKERLLDPRVLRFIQSKVLHNPDYH